MRKIIQMNTKSPIPSIFYAHSIPIFIEFIVRVSIRNLSIKYIFIFYSINIPYKFFFSFNVGYKNMKLCMIAASIAMR